MVGEKEDDGVVEIRGVWIFECRSIVVVELIMDAVFGLLESVTITSNG